jgi:hypothetical protein
MRACADIAMHFLDRLAITQPRTTGSTAITCELSRVPLRPCAHDDFLVFSGLGKAAHQSKAGECVYRPAKAAAVRAIASGSQHKAMRAISQRIVCFSSPPSVGAPPIGLRPARV